MKKNLFFFFLAGIILSIVACQKNPLTPPVDPTNTTNTTNTTLTTRSNHSFNPCLAYTEVALADLPMAIQDYLTTNHPTANVDGGYQFDDSGTITYGIELDDDMTGLLFDADGALLFEGVISETDIAAADLPMAIQDYLMTNYPDSLTESAALYAAFDESFYVVELEGSTELVFDADGNFLCAAADDDDDDGTNDDDDDGNNDDGNNDDDDDDDDDDITLDSLPVVIQDYINQNYPDYVFEEADDETLCDGTAALVIDLENSTNLDDELKLYFDANNDLLFTATEMLSADLPAEVTASIAANYANYTMDNDATLLTMADGSLQYEVELEDEATDTELTVIFDSTGAVLCEETD